MVKNGLASMDKMGKERVCSNISSKKNTFFWMMEGEKSKKDFLQFLSTECMLGGVVTLTRMTFSQMTLVWMKLCSRALARTMYIQNDINQIYIC
jgi:hypothetical protein